MSSIVPPPNSNYCIEFNNYSFYTIICECVAKSCRCACFCILINCTVLVAVGGFDDNETPTNKVYAYEPSNDSWHVIGHFSKARYQTLVATLPGNQMKVVGGYDSNFSGNNLVEIGSV